MRTAVESAKLGFSAYLIPFMFVYNIELLGLGEWSLVIAEAATAAVALVALAAALEGWFAGSLRLYLRTLIGLIALGAIVLDGPLELLFVAALVAVAGFRIVANRRLIRNVEGAR